jgi:uncharacterized protein (TIGR03067 family)
MIEKPENWPAFTFLEEEVTVFIHRFALLCSCVLILPCATRAVAQERTNWEYGQGYFEKTKDGKWIENAKDGTFEFQEKQQTDKYILLIDKSRNIAVRLEEKACYVRTGGKGQFKLTYKGGWVAAEKKGDPGKTTEAPDKKGDPAKEELTKLEGTWLLVRSEVDGMKSSDENAKNARLVIKGNRMTVYAGKFKSSQSTITLDPAKKPKTIDATQTFGGPKGTKVPGIYELDGDSLTICSGEKQRPRVFNAEKGSGRSLDVWKRANY